MKPTFNPPRRWPVAAQQARRETLDQLRLQRHLTLDERAEIDWLDHAYYMRIYRAQRIEKFGAINAHRRPRTSPRATS